MSRNALRVFFERVIVASLPLVIPACGGGNPGTNTTPGDMAMVLEPGDMAANTGGDDLANPGIADSGVGPDLDSCEVDHPVTSINVPSNFPTDAGFYLCVTGSPCSDYCPSGVTGQVPDPAGYTTCCSPKPSDGGAYLVACKYNCGPSGRRPAGLEEAAASHGCAVGQYFASMAHLEAASVHAFRAMARELRAHGAPRGLIAQARRAARDEIRHARLTRAMAKAHGGAAAPVKVTAPASRSLEAMAVENAVEGCVRETFGALLASWQARAAGDRHVRAMMASIAEDEARHADLAWALDAWTRTKLDRAARHRVLDARRAAVADLARELDEQPTSAELVAEVGLPDADRARQFLDAATRELWS